MASGRQSCRPSPRIVLGSLHASVTMKSGLWPGSTDRIWPPRAPRHRPGRNPEAPALRRQVRPRRTPVVAVLAGVRNDHRRRHAASWGSNSMSSWPASRRCPPWPIRARPSSKCAVCAMPCTEQVGCDAAQCARHASTTSVTSSRSTANPGAPHGLVHLRERVTHQSTGFRPSHNGGSRRARANSAGLVSSRRRPACPCAPPARSGLVARPQSYMPWRYPDRKSTLRSARAGDPPPALAVAGAGDVDALLRGGDVPGDVHGLRESRSTRRAVATGSTGLV